MISPAEIQGISDVIVKTIKPEKVILFGSYGRGDATDDSDVDLFVVAATSLPRKDRSPAIRRLFVGKRIPLDILVYTPDEVAYWKDTPASLVAQVLREGRVLYAEQSK